MNFDLQDGKPPVSFSLKTDDCDRFMDFMQECHGYKNALQEALTRAQAIATNFTRDEDAVEIDALISHLKASGI